MFPSSAPVRYAAWLTPFQLTYPSGALELPLQERTKKKLRCSTDEKECCKNKTNPLTTYSLVNLISLACMRIFPMISRSSLHQLHFPTLLNIFFRCAFASLQASNASIRVVKREGVPPFTTLIEALEAWEAKSYCDFQTTMSTSVPLTCGHKEDRYNYKGRGVCKHDVCKGVRDAGKKRKKEAVQAESNAKRQKILRCVRTPPRPWRLIVIVFFRQK